MTSSKATPPKQLAYDHKWQTFIEFTLSGGSDSIHLATDLVVGTVQTLNWTAAHLEQVKQAVATAIQNVLEQSQLNNSGAFLIVRVFILEDEEGPADVPRPHQPEQVRRPPAHGWGFFLVQKQGDASPLLPSGPHHLIELFLYQESHRLFHR